MKINAGLMALTSFLLVACNPAINTPKNLGSNTIVSEKNGYTQTRIHRNVDIKNLNGLQLPEGALEVEIAGEEITIDKNSHPLKGFLAAKFWSVSKLQISAKKIIVAEHLHLPDTDIELIAEEILFLKDGKLENTPLPFLENPTPVESIEIGLPKAKTGLPGKIIQLVAEKINFEGALSPRLVAQGGQGQNAAPGKDGINGNIIPALTNIQHHGKTYQVIYKSAHVIRQEYECNREMFRTLDLEIIARGPSICISNRQYKEVGLNQWPAHGGPATSGGYPGVGGAGGNIIISSKEIQNKNKNLQDLQPILMLSPGQAGLPAREYKGGAAGIPKDAAMLIYYGNNGNYNTVIQESQPGTDAPSPQIPLEESQPPGKFHQAQSPVLQSALFFETKVKYIEDLYRSRRYPEAMRELDFALKKIQSNTFLSAKNPKILSAALRLGSLHAQLLSQRDFFGFGKSEIPLYNFRFTSLQFKRHLETSINKLYLTERLLFALEKEGSSYSQTKEDLGQLEELIFSDFNNQTKLQDSLTSLTVELEGIHRSEKVIIEYLQEIEAQLEREARSNVRARERKAKLLGALKGLAQIAKVIPVWQPALAAGASVVDLAIDSGENQGLGDWIKTVNGIYKTTGTLFSAETLKASFKNYQDFSTEVKNLDLKESTAFLEKLYKDLKPLQESILSTAEVMKRNTAPADKIAAELERLKQQDAIFQKVAAMIEEHASKKAIVYNQIINFSKELTDNLSRIEKNIALKIQAETHYLQIARMGDTGLRDLLQDIQTHSFADLEFYLNELIRSYEYLTFKSVSSPLQLNNLKNQALQLAQKNLDIAEATKLISIYYLDIFETITSRLEQESSNHSPQLRPRSLTRTLALTNTQLEELNKFGQVKFRIDRSLFNLDSYNIKIMDLNVRDARFTISGANNLNGRASRITLGLADSGQLKLNPTETRDYVFGNNLQGLKWTTEFQDIRGQLIIQKGSQTPLTNILSLFLGASAEGKNVLDILTQPPALTTLLIKKDDLNGSQFTTRELLIDLTYSYTEAIY